MPLECFESDDKKNMCEKYDQHDKNQMVKCWHASFFLLLHFYVHDF